MRPVLYRILVSLLILAVFAGTSRAKTAGFPGAGHENNMLAPPLAVFHRTVRAVLASRAGYGEHGAEFQKAPFPDTSPVQAALLLDTILARSADTNIAEELFQEFVRYPYHLTKMPTAAQARKAPVRLVRLIREVAAVTKLASLYAIEAGSFQRAADEVAAVLWKDVILPEQGITGKTAALLGDHDRGGELIPLLYDVVYQEDFLAIADPHATYRSVAKILAAFPLAQPIVAGDMAYRGSHYFELQLLLDDVNARRLLGEKELWYLGCCLGNEFLTALAVANELRYKNEGMLRRLGIDLRPLMEFANTWYREEARRRLKERLRGSFNSLAEQALFNIRIKTNPFLNAAEKGLLLARVPDGFLLLRKDIPAHAGNLVERIRQDPDLAHTDLLPDEQALLRELAEQVFSLTDEEKDLLRNLQEQFISSQAARGLLRRLLDSLELYAVVEPLPLSKRIDRKLREQLGERWITQKPAVLLHGNVVVDERGEFLDINGIPLRGMSVRGYYDQLDHELQSFRTDVVRGLHEFEAGNATAEGFLRYVQQHPTMRLVEKLSLSPFSPLFARHEKGVEYMYVRDVEEPDNPAYAFQSGEENEAALFMDRVFRQLEVPEDSLLVIGHKSMKGKIEARAGGRVLMIDPYFAEKRAVSTASVETGLGAAVLWGSTGVYTYTMVSSPDIFSPAGEITAFQTRSGVYWQQFPEQTYGTVFADWRQAVARIRGENTAPGERSVMNALERIFVEYVSAQHHESAGVLSRTAAVALETSI